MRTLWLLLVAACGATGTDDALDDWRGDVPHVRLRGDVEGTPIDVALDAPAVAAATWARCDATPALAATATLLDGELELAIHLDGRDSLTPGTWLGVVPAIDGEPPAEGRANVVLTWRRQRADGRARTRTRSALAGTVVVEHAGPGGVGLFVDTMWPLGGNLTASLTVPCDAR